MNHSNMYAVGLALCTFANIASEEMSRDLANEIDKLLGSSNTYIRKKVRGPPSTAVYPHLILFRLHYVRCALSRRFQILRTALTRKRRTCSRIVIMVSSSLQLRSSRRCARQHLRSSRNSEVLFLYLFAT